MIVEIHLPSGGSIVLDPTEALTSIDVNSARATKGKHIDDTALAINLEAAEEVARQLRIRDVGGLIVIDFIDMANRKHGQKVEETLRSASKGDKARIQFARISRFGLLEMSRQRLHPSVGESTTDCCPRCQGRGSIRTVESMSLQMLARMEDWAEADKKPNLVVQVPSDTGEYLMNNKRGNIARIEENYEVQITLQIRPDLDIPHYRIERQWTENNQQRVEVLEDTSKNKKPPRSGRKLKPVKPVVGIPTPAPEKEAPKKESRLKAILDVLTGQKRRERLKQEAEEAEKQRKKQEAQKKRRRGGRNRKRPAPASAASKAEKADSDSSKKKKQQNKPKAQQQPKAKEETGADKSNGNSEAGATENKKRRRRRRRRRPSGDNSAQKTSAEQQKPQSEPAAPTEG